MTALSGIIAFMIISILIGKRTRRPTRSTYLLIAVVALLQTVFVLYLMFTMPFPEQL